MAEPTLETMFDKRFADIQKRREDLLAKRTEIEEQLHAVEDEYQRVKTAQEALAGKFKATPAERKPRATSTRAPRGARAELRQKLYDLIGQFPEGLTAEGINSELQATDPKEKQKIANVLSLMVKDRVLTWGGRRQPYRLGPAKSEAA
jgi:chromosome segregation ATPase